jgi:hypothetical protein
MFTEKYSQIEGLAGRVAICLVTGPALRHDGESGEPRALKIV